MFITDVHMEEKVKSNEDESRQEGLMERSRAVNFLLCCYEMCAFSLLLLMHPINMSCFVIYWLHGMSNQSLL